MCFLFIGIFSSSSFAVRFENLSIEHGLSQGTIYDLNQDETGYIWIGTNDGLNRYDGVRFTLVDSITDNDGNVSILSDNSVNNISIDKNNNLWLGTQHGGINFLDTKNNRIKHFMHDPNDANTVAHNTIRHSMFDSKGYLWLATHNGLDRLNIETLTFNHYRDSSPNQCTFKIRTLLEDVKGDIWLGITDAKIDLCRFSPKTGEFIPVKYRNNSSESDTSGIRDLHLDKSGSIWIGSINGLFLYNPNDKSSVEFMHDPNDETTLPNKWTQRIVDADEDHLWVATIGGLGLLNKKDRTFKNFKKNKMGNDGLSREEIFSIFVDKSGLLWIGTNGSGLDIYNPRQTVFNYIGADGKSGYALSDPSVWEIRKGFGYLWIATSKGLNRYNLKTGEIKYYFPDSSNSNSILHDNIHSIMVGKNRDLWISTQMGLNHFYVDTEEFESYGNNIGSQYELPFNNILAVGEDVAGNLWLGSYGEGIAILNPDTKEVKQLKHDPDDINSISSDFVDDFYNAADGSFWIGTRNGLDRFDQKTGNITHYRKFNNEVSPGKSEINIMRGSKNGNILIGTPSGLSILDPETRLYAVYTKKDGLEDDYVYGIEEDQQGYIWISTNRGLTRINPLTREVNNFDVTDGLQGYEFNGSASYNDGTYLYFGGFDGLNYFDPNDIVISSYIPPVVVTEFSVNGKPMNLQGPVHLLYTDNFFSIDFSVLDFTNPSRNQYAYKLEGFDKNWVYSGNRHFASYTNLDGGTYMFRVKGANKYGVWNEKGYSIPIVIDSAPWVRWWAYLIYFLIVSLFAALVVRFKILADSRAIADKMRRMSTSLSQTLNLDTIKNQLANHLQLILPYDQIMIFLKDKDGFREEFNFTVGKNKLTLLEAIEIDRLVRCINEKRQPLLLSTKDEFEDFNINNHVSTKGSVLVLPLITRKSVMGAVILINSKHKNLFRNDYIDMAITLCAQASSSIDNARLFDETKQLAFYDALTGLENRRLFRERLELALKTTKRDNSEIAVLFLDLDKFKRINDSLGHDIGDALLVEAAKRLTRCVRERDTVARIGGDEFIVLLHDVKGVQGANIIAKKILKVFEEPLELYGSIINISTSIGISMAPKDCMSANTLIKNADMAMYKAKDKGRNNYQFYTEEMNIQALQLLDVENSLRIALQEDQLELFFQPIIDLKTHKINSVEALIRWNHPQRGLILPELFILKSEETDLINQIGEWVLGEACAQGRRIVDNKITPMKIAVNISAKQIMQGQLMKTIKRLLDEHNLDAKWLGLEITENAIIDSIDETVNMFSALKGLDIALAIDDFGTGYSSLSHLKQLPADIVKIDYSFIRDIPTDKEDVEITAAIIAMAHKLNLRVIAEGVETKEQLDFLISNQCDMVQGFYFYRPMPANDLIELLQYQDEVPTKLIEC